MKSSYITILLLLSKSIVSLSDYKFKVFSVVRCPMNKEEWDMASFRLNCSESSGYHCVPNKYLTSLVEFCYPRGNRLLFGEADGILNHVPCNNTFTCGCPNLFYFSNEIYKHPMCLSINPKLRCFNADIECILSRNASISTEQDLSDVAKGNDDGRYDCTASFAAAILTSMCFIISTICIILTIKGKNPLKAIKKYRNIPQQDNVEIKDNSRNRCTESTRNEQLLTEAHNIIHHEMGEITCQSAEVRELRESILNGNHKKCRSLLESRCYDLEEMDMQGFNVLHLSAKKDNMMIFELILKEGVSINNRTKDEQTVLHIAACNGCYSICHYILQHHDHLFSFKDRQGMNPAHCAALEGHVHILNLMLQFECDMTEKTTRYKENIVHLACMAGSLDVCKFVASNENISGLLHAKNREGWNSIQCAGKNGHLDVLKFLYEHGVDLKNKSNKTGKNCLHTVCENGYYKICEYVLQKQPKLLTEVDNVDQHAGHYAAKIGHKDTLQLLVKTNKDILLKATSDNINIFHIACRHAWYEMCVFIHETYPSLISEITEKGWNAGLFVTERGDAEEERLKILNFLVQHELDLCHVSRSGKTIYINAKKNSLPNLVKYVLEKCPDVENVKRSISTDTSTTNAL